jgi:outer membrane receptor protein involved in Fe transport
MNTPNRLVGEGDKYGYDYYGHVQSQSTWLTYKLAFANFEIDLGGETGFTRMWREGLYKKGLFPDNSEGNSEKKGFWTYTAKAGINYRISGSQMVYANFARMQDAPQFQNAFVSPRTRNEYVSDLSTEKTTSVDLNYELRLPSVKMRLSGFYTDIRDKMNVINFYDDLSGTFTNFSMSGIDELYTGLEFGLSVPITQSLTAVGVFSYGYYKYNSNPYVTQTRDNSAEIILDNERVRWKDMKIAGTPQTAASIGLNYRGPNNIYASIDGNFFDAMYLSMNPMYRTDNAMQGLESDSEGIPDWMSKDDKVRDMAHQERFKQAFVFNASVGKSWRLPHGLFLGANLDVRNILNSKSIKTGGYEQMRFSKMSDNGEYNTHYSRFDSKYYYMYGTTYYLNVYLRF